MAASVSASWTPILLVLVVLLLLGVIFLLMRPAPRMPVSPPVIVMAPPPNQLRRTTTPMDAAKVYGDTTMTYRTVVPQTAAATASMAPYFPEVSRSIPTDFTMESCPCPYSKPQKTDVPLATIPLCTLLQQSSYKLSQFQPDAEKMT